MLAKEDQEERNQKTTFSTGMGKPAFLHKRLWYSTIEKTRILRNEILKRLDRWVLGLARALDS